MTDNDNIAWRLAQLASLTYQERYVIGGTKDEYLLDTELIENVDAIRYMLERGGASPTMSDEQATSLQDLLAYVAAHSEEALSAKSREEQTSMIRDSKVWRTLRSKAAVALASFGYATDMSIEEIDAISV